MWDIVLRSGTQLRYSPKGTLLGFDHSALLDWAQVLGYDSKALLLLLADAENGLMEADHGNINAEHLNQDSGS